MKMQSAMEYLFTYGWALLIIAIIVLTFWYLHVFNPLFFAPKAIAGECYVSQGGAGASASGPQLMGVCNNQIPQFVFAAQGPGDVVYISNSSSPSSVLNVQNSITISAWVYIQGSPYHDVVDKEGQYGMKLDHNNQPHPCSPSNNPGWCLEWDTSNDWNGISYPIPNGNIDEWIFLAVSAQGSNKYWYANGQLIGSENVPGTAMSYAPTNLVIGSISEDSIKGYGGAEWYDGMISNVQIYSVALSQNSISALYNEGVGGTPIDVQDLVGWWPLNGNGNDYSGNGNNGVANTIAFNGGWWTTYGGGNPT